MGTSKPLPKGHVSTALHGHMCNSLCRLAVVDYTDGDGRDMNGAGRYYRRVNSLLVNCCASQFARVALCFALAS